MIDDDELDDVELQKEETRPFIVTGIPVTTPSSSKKKAARRGCPCWCKCIGMMVMIFTLFGMLAMACAYSYFKNVVEQLTVETDSPQKFPIVEMSERELEKVLDRVSSFFEDVRYEESDIEDLVLDQDEINGFIGHSDYLRGNLLLTLHKDRIVEEYSLPMDIIGLDGRYFVGNDYTAFDRNSNVIEMKMETEATHEDWFDGPLFFMQLQYLVTKNKEDEGRTMFELYLEKGSFFGQVIPQEVMDEHTNLLDGLYDADDDDFEDMLDVMQGIESVSIKEGKVVVTAKRHSSD